MRQWDRLARFNAMWAILTGPETLSGELSDKVFFETGRNEVAAVLHGLADLGIEVRRGTALDFGCGMGRVAQGLCEVFERCEGVDVASRMIRLAERYNRAPERCRYRHNTRPDLRLFADGTFDLVYSRLVLQHVPPRLGRAYLHEMVRVAAPGGVLWLQAPSRRLDRPRTVALPPEAYRAHVEIMSAPARVPAGAMLRVEARVRNAGAATWPAAGARPVHLANHWLDAQGAMERLDDGRAALGRDLPPGGSSLLTLAVRAPARGGRFTLELDLVHEGVTWFAARGSPTVRAPVEVEGDGATPAPDADRAPLGERWRRLATRLAAGCSGRRRWTCTPTRETRPPRSSRPPGRPWSTSPRTTAAAPTG